LGLISTGNYYRVLCLAANPGRTIVPADDAPGAAPVAVISPRYWRSRFVGDAKTIGKVVRINNVPTTIVGVISPESTDVQLALTEGPVAAVHTTSPTRIGVRVCVRPRRECGDRDRVRHRPGAAGDGHERERHAEGDEQRGIDRPAGSVNSTSIFVQGRTYEQGSRDENSINRLIVSAGFFDTMEMPMRAGRRFSAHDDQAAQ
jgi:hypothetical protein